MRCSTHSAGPTAARLGLWLAALFAITCLAASVAGAANPTKVRYDVTVIGDFSAPLPPGGLPVPNLGSASLGMNNAGDVVGWSYYTAADNSVFGLQYDSSTGALIKLRGFGGWQSWAEAINDSSVVVGGATLGGRIGPYPAVWNDGVITKLFPSTPDCPTELSCGGYAYDINTSGDIVGFLWILSSLRQAFIYANGAFHYFGHSGTVPAAINDRGTVVGTQIRNEEPYIRDAFIYRNGMMSDLGTLGGANKSANDVSENDQVVGGADLATGERHAFLWRHGVMRDLGTLGGNFSEATAVNKTGSTIVGNSDGHGFVYRGGRMVDLNELIEPGIGTIVNAQDVNDSGQIAGDIAVLRTIAGYDRYVTYAMLLTPRK